MRVKGESSEGLLVKPLLIMLWTDGQPKEVDAYFDAVRQVHNAIGLVDAQFYKDTWYVPFLYEVNKTLVDGKPLVRK